MSRKRNKQTDATIYDVACMLALHREEICSLAYIVRECGYKKRASSYIEELLTTLESYGIVEYEKGYRLSHNACIYTGTICISRGGAYFCSVEGGKDIFIPPEARYDASANDIVEVLIVIPENGNRKAEGCVLAIRTKATHVIPARAVQKLSLTSFLFESVLIGVSLRFHVTFDDEKDIPYDIFRLVYAVAQGEQYNNNIREGRLIECLGREYHVSTQEKIVQIENALRRVFPVNVLASVEDIPQEPTQEQYTHRKNLERLAFVTIDGEDSRDFDDAIYVEKTKKGYILYVAIADVTEYVQWNTALDEEARIRSNSYYFPTMVLPMLPQALSNGICSLQPNVPRLAMIVEIECNDEGEVTRKDVYEGIIRSHARLTYTQVQQYFDMVDAEATHEGKKNKKLTEEAIITEPIGIMLQKARSIAQLLNEIRCKRGALSFTSTTPYFTISNDNVHAVCVYPRYYAHSLIEECMLIANEAIADILTEHGYPVVYRTHTPPREEKLEALRTYALCYFPHQPIPKIHDPHFMQRLLEIVAGTPQEHTFHNIAIRSMMQARYSLEDEGHYGLQSERYCHFTSPIRRYADCLVHRAVKAYLRKQSLSHDEEEQMSALIDVLNKNERIAMIAERDIHKRLGALYMKQYIGSMQTVIISGISKHALYVDFPMYALSGVILFSSLCDDYYDVREESQQIVGRRTGKIYTLGDTIDVLISNVSLVAFEIQCTIVSKQQRAVHRMKTKARAIRKQREKKEERYKKRSRRRTQQRRKKKR